MQLAWEPLLWNLMPWTGSREPRTPLGPRRCVAFKEPLSFWENNVNVASGQRPSQCPKERGAGRKRAWRWDDRSCWCLIWLPFPAFEGARLGSGLGWLEGMRRGPVCCSHTLHLPRFSYLCQRCWKRTARGRWERISEERNAAFLLWHQRGNCLKHVKWKYVSDVRMH